MVTLTESGVPSIGLEPKIRFIYWLFIIFVW